MSDSHPPEFTGDAAELPRHLKELLGPELQTVFRKLAPKRPAQAIIVSRCFGGYADKGADRTVLGRWFFPGAESDAKAAAAFYHGRLGTNKDKDPDKQVLRLWHDRPDRADLRREAVWVLCGRDKPTADPVTEPARYLDPVEYV